MIDHRIRSRECFNVCQGALGAHFKGAKIIYGTQTNVEIYLHHISSQTASTEKFDFKFVHKFNQQNKFKLYL